MLNWIQALDVVPSSACEYAHALMPSVMESWNLVLSVPLWLHSLIVSASEKPCLSLCHLLCPPLSPGSEWVPDWKSLFWHHITLSINKYIYIFWTVKNVNLELYIEEETETWKPKWDFDTLQISFILFPTERSLQIQIQPVLTLYMVKLSYLFFKRLIEDELQGF